MDMTETDSEVLFRKKIRDWLKKESPENVPQGLEQRRDWHRKLYAAGFVGITWPSEHGGLGLGPMAQAILSSEMALANAAAPINQAGLEITGPSLMQYGTQEQKNRYLRSILSGDELWCQLYSEPNAGSDLASLKTSAVRNGDDFIVSGQKVWISEGSWADFGVLLARTNRDTAKHKGISCFILDMKAQGVEVRPLRQLTGSAHFSEVFLSDVRIPAQNLIGNENEGWSVAMSALAFERGGNSLARITRYEMALRNLVKTLKTLLKDDRPMIEDTGIRRRLGSAWGEIEVQRITAIRLLSLAEHGEELLGLPSAHKLSYSEFERRFTDMAMELLGPWGRLTDSTFLKELGVGTSSAEPGTWAHAMLWSRAVTIFAGTSQIQRNIIADRTLMLPKEPKV
jgi:alkylation response protein AidB-like acyl-CoA dehydrogenase